MIISKSTFSLLMILFQVSFISSQIENKLVDEILSQTSKKYNYQHTETNEIALGYYEVQLEEGVEQVYGSGAALILDNNKVNKKMNSVEHDILSNHVSDFLLENAYESVNTSSDLTTITYKSLRQDSLATFIIVYIPLSSDKDLEVAKITEFKTSGTDASVVDLFVRNSSFEVQNNEVNFPEFDSKFWYDCGAEEFPQETPPEIRNAESGMWGFSSKATEGNNYILMVTRRNGSKESISQRLNTRLKKNSCYEFYLDLKTAESFWSGSRDHMGDVDDLQLSYTDEACLHISLSNYLCNENQVIFESEPVENINWKSNKVLFKAEENFKFIKFSADQCGYNDIGNGNLLLDNINNFREVKCPVEDE